MFFYKCYSCISICFSTNATHANVAFVEKHVCEGENCGIKSKSNRGFEKGDMHVVNNHCVIKTYIPKLVPMFFHMDSTRKFRSSIQSRRSITIVIIIIGVRGVVDNKGEKKLLMGRSFLGWYHEELSHLDFLYPLNFEKS
jgi:hypothetical protein